MDREGRFPPCELWDFAVAAYAKPGVAPACLSLQARHGVDVNLLLFCLWLGASGRGRLAPEALRRAAESVAPWHQEIVRSLRTARDGLKGASIPVEPALARRLRERILAVELEAEHVEELILAGLAPLQGDGHAALETCAEDAVLNMRAYFATLVPDWDIQDQADFRALLEAVFPGLGAETLLRRFAPRRD